MPGDASLPPHAPMTNGDLPVAGHGEADASSSSSSTTHNKTSSHSSLTEVPERTATATTSLAQVCADFHGRVSAFLCATPNNETTKRTQEQTRISLEVIEKAVEDYGFEHLSLSYNGGKDCLVLLILYLSVLHKHFTRPQCGNKNDNISSNGSRQKLASDDSSSQSAFPKSIPSIYAKPPDPFPAVTEFVESSSRRYHLDLTHILTSKPVHPHQVHVSSAAGGQVEQSFTFPEAFDHYLFALHPDPSSSPVPVNQSSSAVRRKSTIHAIFVGTRRTDPHGGNLTHFDPTDHNWPPFMRVHPVIDWHLSEIWCFLRADQLREPDGRHLEYCSMYDEGYTSLGGVGDTVRNPKLRYVDDHGGRGQERFKPAYELTADKEERLGRE